MFTRALKIQHRRSRVERGWRRVSLRKGSTSPTFRHSWKTRRLLTRPVRSRAATQAASVCLCVDGSVVIFPLMDSQWAAAFTSERAPEQLHKSVFDVSALAAMFSRAVRIRVNRSTSVFFFLLSSIYSALTSFSSASSGLANILF